MYKIAVCDECAMDRERLILQIKHINKDRIEIWIHEYSSGEELLVAINYIKFAVIFIDIKMKGVDGNEVTKKIREVDINLVLAFYTSFLPSMRSFEFQPYRYIMKNMTDLKMSEYVEAVLGKMLENTEVPLLHVNINKRQLFIRAEHVIYIEKYKKSTRVHITEYSYKIYSIQKDENEKIPDIRLGEKLEIIYEKLKQYGYGWPHNSYIINLNYLCSCTAKALKLMEVNNVFQITRSKAKEFNELKSNFIQSKYIEGCNPK